MPFNEALKLISKSNIPVIVDCKHYDAWSLTKEIVARIGPHRCLVHIYASELKFDYNIYDNNYSTEWLKIEQLKELKNKYPNVTTTVSAKYLPNDLLLGKKYKDLLYKIRSTLKNNYIDTVCLNVPDKTMSDNILDFFLEENIIPHVNIDNLDVSKLSRLYIGETDSLSSASESKILDY